MSINFFISYTDKDKKKMEALSKAIDKAKKSFHPIIVSKSHAPLVPLSDKVINGINTSHFIIPIISSSSIQNQWVNQEIGYAKAKNLKIFPIVDKSIINHLKGFINDQMDLPFRYDPHKSNKRKEAANFRKCYNELISYLLESIIENIFYSRITPKRIKQGDEYKTLVQFNGYLRNGFFDNYIQHLESKWTTWNWDKSTLNNIDHTSPGKLHGKVNIKSTFKWSTENWPIGNYRIYVRVYDHIIPGQIGRKMIAEKVHDFEVY